MPFLKGGRYAITRTAKYLNAGQLVLKNSVKVIAINHVPGTEISKGCDDFIKWFLPPMQFKNPNVQIITLKGACPTPFIKVYLHRDEEVVLDCSYREHRDIHDQMTLLFNKSASVKIADAYNQTKSPANFGRE